MIGGVAAIQQHSADSGRDRSKMLTLLVNFPKSEILSEGLRLRFLPHYFIRIVVYASEKQGIFAAYTQLAIISLHCDGRWFYTDCPFTI